MHHECYQTYLDKLTVTHCAIVRGESYSTILVNGYSVLRDMAQITRLGAKQDGVLRNHSKNADGSYRDTVVFSIIDHEWLMVKRSLQHKLSRG